MTVPATPRRAGPYTGNGVTLTFPFSFKVFSAADLRVDLATDAGVESLGVLNDTFTVSLNADQTATPGGTVSYAVSGVATALPTGYSLAITGARALAQTVTLPTGGAYHASSVEGAMDSLQMQIQQVDEGVGRALTLSPLAPSGTSTTLPAPGSNKLIGWNEAATGLQNMDPGVLATIVAFGTTNADQFTGDGTTTTFTLSASPAALNNLDISIGGATQRPGVDYTWVSGTTLTFTSAPPNGVPILVRYMQGLPQGYTDAALVSFSGGGTVDAELLRIGRQVVSVTDPRFGAVGNGSANDTTAIANAAAYAATLPYGATLYFPRGRYMVTAIPALAPNVNWRGEGRLASQIMYSGTGDGLKYSAAAVNTYTALRITISDLAIACSNAGNTGGGLVLEGCSYVNIHNCYFEKFKYGHILDAVIHFRCTYSELAQQTRACIWVVNGPDRRVGQNTGWTNNIWYGTEIQLNCSVVSGIYLLQDDGGFNHHYEGVNFNAGDIGARFAGVGGLTVINCDFEGTNQSPVVWDDNTRETAAYVGACRGVTFRANNLSSLNRPYQMSFLAFDGGEISQCGFAQFTVAAFFFNSSGAKVRGLKIHRNYKTVAGNGLTGKPWFDSSLPTDGRVSYAEQISYTYVTASATPGATNATPATVDMFSLGEQVYCVNADGTNGEFCTITFLTATVIGVTLTSAKAANWVISGQSAETTEGTWTPTIFGTTTAGANTYTLQQGTWKRDHRTGMVHVVGTLTMSVKDAAMAGNIEIAGLPFPCANVTNRNQTGNISFYSGLTFPANFTQLGIIVTPNSQRLALRRFGSGQTGAALAVSEIAAGATLAFEAIFYTK